MHVHVHSVVCEVAAGKQAAAAAPSASVVVERVEGLG